MKKLLKMLSKRFLVIAFILFTFFVVASGNSKETIVSYNTNNAKSVQAVHIVNKYNSLLEERKTNNKVVATVVGSFYEAINIAPKQAVSFPGMMTSYGPDCAGCGGHSACPPRQDLTNGNIYFNDSLYGKVRILATDSSIPCGTIIKVTNPNVSAEPFYAIALDRGGAIVGGKMDLLYETEVAAMSAGTQYNVTYEINRWGW